MTDLFKDILDAYDYIANDTDNKELKKEISDIRNQHINESKIRESDSLHDRMCKWLINTHDFYDMRDATDIDEDPIESTYNMTDDELIDAIRYTLDNEEELWYNDDDDTDDSSAREDGESLISEFNGNFDDYKNYPSEEDYPNTYEGYLNYCKDTNADPMTKEDWSSVTGINESKMNEDKEYFQHNKDGVYVARKVKDQKGKEDYADWQTEYLGSKRRARWVNSPLYARRFKNEEDAQKYLDDNGKDDYYGESKMKESKSHHNRKIGR